MYGAKTEPFSCEMVRASFEGPGMPRYSNEAIVWREADAFTLCRLLSMAYKAGQDAKAAEISSALEVDWRALDLSRAYPSGSSVTISSPWGTLKVPITTEEAHALCHRLADKRGTLRLEFK